MTTEFSAFEETQALLFAIELQTNLLRSESFTANELLEIVEARNLALKAVWKKLGITPTKPKVQEVQVPKVQKVQVKESTKPATSDDPSLKILLPLGEAIITVNNKQARLKTFVKGHQLNGIGRRIGAIYKYKVENMGYKGYRKKLYGSQATLWLYPIKELNEWIIPQIQKDFFDSKGNYTPYKLKNQDNKNTQTVMNFNGEL